MVKSGMASLTHAANASASSTSPSYVSGSASSLSVPCGNSTAATHFLSSSDPSVAEKNSSGAYLSASFAPSGEDAFTSIRDTRPLTPLIADDASRLETSTHARSPSLVNATTATGGALSTSSSNRAGVTAGKSDPSPSPSPEGPAAPAPPPPPPPPPLAPLEGPTLPPRASKTSGASSSGAASAALDSRYAASERAFISPPCLSTSPPRPRWEQQERGGSIVAGSASSPGTDARTSGASET